VETKLRPVVWKHLDHGQGSIWDGTIRPTEFHTRYQPGKGWQIYFNAC